MRNRAITLIILGFVLSTVSLMTYAGNNLSEFRSKTHDIYNAVAMPSKISLDGKVDETGLRLKFSAV